MHSVPFGQSSREKHCTESAAGLTVVAVLLLDSVLEPVVVLSIAVLVSEVVVRVVLLVKEALLDSVEICQMIEGGILEHTQVELPGQCSTSSLLARSMHVCPGSQSSLAEHGGGKASSSLSMQMQIEPSGHSSCALPLSRSLHSVPFGQSSREKHCTTSTAGLDAQTQTELRQSMSVEFSMYSMPLSASVHTSPGSQSTLLEHRTTAISSSATVTQAHIRFGGHSARAMPSSASTQAAPFGQSSG
jgi:hypothetical protein